MFLVVYDGVESLQRSEWHFSSIFCTTIPLPVSCPLCKGHFCFHCGGVPPETYAERLLLQLESHLTSEILVNLWTSLSHSPADYVDVRLQM